MEKTSEQRTSLRRAVGIWGSYTWGYACVGADVYMALGIVIAAAMGAAPFAFLFAGILFLFISFIYTELASAYPVAGGGHYYALRGLGDFWGFVAGWALLLDFTIDVSLFVYSAVYYFDYFFPTLQQSKWIPFWQALFLTLLLIVLNIKGIRESSRLNEVLSAIDMINESIIIILGFVFAFKPDLFLYQITHHFPPMDKFLYGMSLAIVAYVGIETISQAAEETVRPASIIPRTSITLAFSILIYALAFSVLGVGSVGWKPLADHMKDPIAYLARFLPIIGPVAGPFTAILAFTLLYASANTGVMGYSRLTHSMSNLRILPEWFGAVHPRYRTPYRTILVFSGAVIIQLLVATLSPNALETLADMYAFGALTTYVLVIISHLRLRLTDPYTPRPFKLWGNIKIRRNGETVELPLLGLLALLGAIFFFGVVIWTHHWARLLGSTWIIAGLVLYFTYRKKNNFPLLGSLERDWVDDQIRVLKEAGEIEYLEEYIKALEQRRST